MSDHRTQDEARALLIHWAAEVSYQEGVAPTSQTEDRVDFDTSNVGDYDLGWLRVVECNEWTCYTACVARDWYEFRT